MSFRSCRFFTLLIAMFVLSGCFSTGYKVMAENKKEEPVGIAGKVDLRNCSLGVDFGDGRRSGKSEYLVYLGFSNVISNGNNLKITGIEVSLKNPAHSDNNFSLSTIHLYKWVKDDSSDRSRFVDAVVKNPVPFNLTNSEDHHYGYEFINLRQRTGLRKARVNVAVSVEWEGRTETVKDSFLFKRYHYFLWN